MRSLFTIACLVAIVLVPIHLWERHQAALPIQPAPEVTVIETVSPEEMRADALAAEADSLKTQLADSGTKLAASARDVVDARQQVSTVNKSLADSRAECRSLAQQLKASDVKAADLQFKLDHFQCPLPDHSKCIAEIAELKKQLAACAEKRASIPNPNPVLPWSSDLAAAEAKARELGRPVFIDFETANCGPCKRVKHDVYETSEVSTRLRSEFVPVWLYTPSPTADSERFSVTRFPKAVVLRGADDWDVFIPEPEPNAFMDQLDQYSK